MEKIKISIRQQKLLADTITPVGIYLKLRDRFANSFLLESSDYHGEENSFSYICCDPMASFQLIDGKVTTSYPDGSTQDEGLSDQSAVDALRAFSSSFEVEKSTNKHIETGLFGYMAYDSVQHFEEIELDEKEGSDIPEISYHLFRYIIALDHFKNECFVIENFLEEPKSEEFQEIVNLIHQRNVTVSYTHLRAHETKANLVCRLLLEKKN